MSTPQLTSRLLPALSLGALVFAACGKGAPETQADTESVGAFRSALERVVESLGLASVLPSYVGHDSRGIPHYAQHDFTAEERTLLRKAYGIEDPGRLYISDSTEDGLLKYDTRVKRCASCYVNSYIVGFVSVRRPGESWEELEHRVAAMTPRDFSAEAHDGSTSLAGLDPDIQDDVRRMLDDARATGFVFHVAATYRSPEREAFVMAGGRGRTHTLTSLHSYGRAIDVVIRDGKLRTRATRDMWVAFRRWVRGYRAGEFLILGSPERTWDWSHVSIPDARIGFRTIDDAVAKARSCLGGPPTTTAPTATTSAACDFLPHLSSTRALARAGSGVPRAHSVHESPPGSTSVADKSFQ